MARTRRPYQPELREQLVALVRAGRRPDELAQEFEPSAQTIRNWVGQAATDRGERPGELLMGKASGNATAWRFAASRFPLPIRWQKTQAAGVSMRLIVQRPGES